MADPTWSICKNPDAPELSTAPPWGSGDVTITGELESAQALAALMSDSVGQSGYYIAT